VTKFMGPEPVRNDWEKEFKQKVREHAPLSAGCLSTSKPLVWRLTAFDRPPLEAHMIETKKGGCWFRIFDKRDAVFPVARVLKNAGIRWACDKVEKRTPAPRRPRRGISSDQPFETTREGFGSKLNAAPNRTSWRLKSRRR
jgi:hypothetical protein